MKTTTQEALGLFSQTLPFFLVRAALLTLFSIFSLACLALLLILFQSIGGDLPLTLFILAVASGLYWFIARFFQKHVLFPYKAAQIAYLQRLIRRPPGMTSGEPQIRTGRSLVKGRFPDLHGLYLAKLQAKKLLNELERERQRGTGQKAIPRLFCLAGMPFLEGALLGAAIEEGGAKFSQSLLRQFACFWQGAGDMLPRLRRSGLVNILGFVFFFVLAFIPVCILFVGFSVSIFIGVALALLQAFILKQAFLFPFVQAATCLHLHRQAANAEVRPETSRYLLSLSPRFGDIFA